MREEEEFTEVTLVCEDQGGHQAHKVILDHASPCQDVGRGRGEEPMREGGGDEQ